MCTITDFTLAFSVSSHLHNVDSAFSMTMYTSLSSVMAAPKKPTIFGCLNCSKYANVSISLIMSVKSSLGRVRSFLTATSLPRYDPLNTCSQAHQKKKQDIVKKDVSDVRGAVASQDKLA